MVEEPEAQQSWWVRLRESKAQWITLRVIILLGLGAIAAALSDSVVVGRWFAGALCALLVVILGVAALTLRLVRAFLCRAPGCICNPPFAMAWRTCIGRAINPRPCWRPWAWA